MMTYIECSCGRILYCTHHPSNRIKAHLKKHPDHHEVGRWTYPNTVYLRSKMNRGGSIGRQEAMDAANDFVKRIRPFVDRIQIAGSLRRGKERARDIEIVAKARYHTLLMPESAPIGQPSEVTMKNITHEVMRMMLKNYDINQNRPRNCGGSNPFGERYYRIDFIHRNMEYPIDFFVATPPSDYYVLLVLRTGSAKFSNWFARQGGKNKRIREGHIEVS